MPQSAERVSVEERPEAPSQLSRKFFDEMRAPDGKVRHAYAELASMLDDLSIDSPRHQAECRRCAVPPRRHHLRRLRRRQAGTERLIPFDLIPRIIPPHEWDADRERAACSASRRSTASSTTSTTTRRSSRPASFRPSTCCATPQFRPEMIGRRRRPATSTRTSPASTSSAPASGEYYVLEDNLRVPSRRVLHAREPQDDDAALSRAVRQQPDRAGRALSRPAARDPARRRAARPSTTRPSCVLTPGCYNSAYFEHAFLAQQMGVELVEGRTCSSQDDYRLHAHDRGPQRVDVIYRRVDDDFLDPLAFRPDSMLGVPGLLSALPRRATSTLANAIGTGVADDKSIYPYVPEMIQFYLGEEPILNNVPTYMLRDPTTVQLRARPTWTSWWSRRCTAPAATACWSARRRPPRSARLSDARPRRPRAATSRSRRWRCRPARPSSTAGSRRATSTCGRSCCRARRSAWCPAA